MTEFKGIDVSKWQGDIDWNKVKEHIDFAIIRAGYGFSKDPKAHEYANNCERLDIPIGVYWFSYAMSKSDAKEEANMALDFAKEHEIKYPIFFDFEDESCAYYKTILKKECSADVVLAFTEAFCNQIESNKYYPGYYCNLNFYKNIYKNSYLKKHPLWLASRGIERPAECDIWQYADNGAVDGINVNVDMNICYKDFPSIITEAGLNNTNKATFRKIYSLIDELKSIIERGEYNGFR